MASCMAREEAMSDPFYWVMGIAIILVILRTIVEWRLLTLKHRLEDLKQISLDKPRESDGR